MPTVEKRISNDGPATGETDRRRRTSRHTLGTRTQSRQSLRRMPRNSGTQSRLSSNPTTGDCRIAVSPFDDSHAGNEHGESTHPDRIQGWVLISFDYSVPGLAVHTALSSTAFSIERCATSDGVSSPPPGRNSNVVGSPSPPTTAASVTTAPAGAVMNSRSVIVSPAGTSVSKCGASSRCADTVTSSDDAAAFSTITVPPGYCGSSSAPVGSIPVQPEIDMGAAATPSTVINLRRSMQKATDASLKGIVIFSTRPGFPFQYRLRLSRREGWAAPLPPPLRTSNVAALRATAWAVPLRSRSRWTSIRWNYQRCFRTHLRNPSSYCHC